MRVQLQPAYVLHTQAYSNTSLLVDIFSQDYGRVRLVAKGVRSAKSSRRALLQAFTPVKISWTGRSDLKTLTDIELDSRCVLPKLSRDKLFNGLYINELLIKLTYSNDPHDEIFILYENTLAEFAITQSQEMLLRNFEYELLESLGYSLAIEALDIDNLQEQWFQYQPEEGLTLSTSKSQSNALPMVQGCHLLALLNKQACDEQGMKQLKNLMRFVLHYHLDGKKIQSRLLYQ